MARFIDGSATAWGDPSFGGDITGVDLSHDVADISCGYGACVARFTDGSATAWGNPFLGGDSKKTENGRPSADLL